MGLGDLTKQIAKEAFASQVDDVVESLRSPDQAAKPDAASAQGESLAAVIMNQVQAMQSALKEDQELHVLCTVGRETVRVFEMFAPSPRVLVLTGVDADRALTRVVLAAEVLQLACKPAAVKEGAKAARLRFVAGKSGKSG